MVLVVMLSSLIGVRVGLGGGGLASRGVGAEDDSPSTSARATAEDSIALDARCLAR